MSGSAPTCAVCGGDLAPGRSVCAPAAECDACRGGGAHDVVERLCAASDARDPIEIAVALLRHRSVPLHGPEHRYVVTASLLAASANVRGDREAARARSLGEARRAIEGGAGKSCACDVREKESVAHAAGVFATVASGKPKLGDELAKAAAKLAGQIKGTPCCKRNAFLAILQACHFARERLGVDVHARGPACEWHPQNKQCIQDACPFYRPGAA